MAMSKEHRMKISQAIRAKGIKPPSRTREAVFSRDDYTCQSCHKKGIELHPHHIYPRADREDMVFDVDNGVTLCVSCHHKEHTWGVGQFVR